MGLRYRTRLEDYRCFFITTTCHNWLNLFINDSYFDILYNSILVSNKNYSASWVGYVLMPNHIHFIIFFHQNNNLISYMRDFKKFTAGEIRRKLEKDKQMELLEKIRFERKEQKFKVWMDGFDDVIMDNEKKLLTKLQYIHENPVEYGLVAKMTDYPHSSAAYYYLQEKVRIPILHVNDI